jgi:hypothetical protein
MCVLLSHHGNSLFNTLSRAHAIGVLQCLTSPSRPEPPTQVCIRRLNNRKQSNLVHLGTVKVRVFKSALLTSRSDSADELRLGGAL